MTRALGPRVGMPPQVGLPLTILTVCWAPLLVAGVVWVAGRTSALLTGHGWTGPPYGFEYGERLVTQGPTGVWPGTPVGLVWVLTALLLLLVTVVPAVVVWRRLARRPSPADPVPSLERVPVTSWL
jgi:predicted anti-sigma-YlaC factor YlaD